MQTTKGWHHGHHLDRGNKNTLVCSRSLKGDDDVAGQKGVACPSQVKCNKSSETQELAADCHSGDEPTHHNIALGIRLRRDEMRFNLCLYFAMFNSA